MNNRFLFIFLPYFQTYSFLLFSNYKYFVILKLHYFKHKMKHILSIFILIFSVGTTIAQETVEMADIFRSNGKIYVVVAVLSIILIGIFLYLISMDRKVKKIEKEVLDKE